MAMENNGFQGDRQSSGSDILQDLQDQQAGIDGDEPLNQARAIDGVSNELFNITSISLVWELDTIAFTEEEIQIALDYVRAD